jgi:hypothetical protein
MKQRCSALLNNMSPQAATSSGNLTRLALQTGTQAESPQEESCWENG